MIGCVLPFVETWRARALFAFDQNVSGWAKMRPAIRAALQNSTRPDQAITVFAGQDREATERARTYFSGYPPSSPSIGILREGELVYMMQRSDIETSDPQTIALKLAQAFNQYCSKSAV